MFGTLNVINSGLTTAQRAAQAATDNIANQNTEGYVRRTTQTREAEQLGGNGTGRGVTLGETIRNTNDFIYKNFVGESTSLSYYEELSGMLSNIEKIFTESEESGFSKDLDAFFQKIEDLKSNPQDSTYQENLKTQAKIVVDDLQTLYGQLDQQETIIKSELKTDVRDINKIVQNIGSINSLIASAAIPQETLLDRRDMLEKELAQMVNIKVTKDNGDYLLEVGSVTAVRNSNVRPFSYGEESVTQIDRYAQYNAGTGLNESTLGTVMTNPTDKMIYELNDSVSIELTVGQALYDQSGSQLDIDGNGTIDASDVVSSSNIIRSLTLAINNDPEISKYVTAYNGNYTKDSDGNIIPDSDNTVDRYLVIQSNKSDLEGKFQGDLKYLTDSDANSLYEVNIKTKNETQSVEAGHSSFINSYDAKITVSDGSVKAKIDNLTTNSPLNVIQQFKDKLDAFAATLSDMSDKYVKNSDGTYIYGETAIESSGEAHHNSYHIGLFSGSSVSTLSFNDASVNTLEQKDYDYLATFQNKSDILFNNVGQEDASHNYQTLTSDGTIGTTFSKYFQSFQIDVSTQNANISFLRDTQQIVTRSLQNSYEKMVKVDPDQEMLDLMKFQAAYEANAKMATVIQDMIRTTLNMI
ncbi:MAG: FlgK family flagellar hook-associated protein [Candidatus Marinarcus sp.]|uniref:FlgK family flagellar hook-associated protein n=1 Tax=Candidatus Marinarcus sp. TaxID=3100987 RepID=UPI003AFFA1B1